ncbi:MAG: hypothetical protein AMQ74_01620 [Candidatus Methanofastidiosum methylothiophilum]|uniref:Large polyvalent protein associated domain-containing protein n=1 Tax=Candidatus Methanofastidiosum methylothiophilum TaxID=1705564 RepID=A0A150ITC0_9EURY|nr:MAG: hypothetical protein AMQ74_01620 [Candidatus Methanofastidiosum methylthiophilus]
MSKDIILTYREDSLIYKIIDGIRRLRGRYTLEELLEKEHGYEEEFRGKTIYIFPMGRVDIKRLPEGYHRYSVRGSDYDWGQAATIEHSVGVNYWGFVLSKEELDLNKVDYGGTKYIQLTKKERDEIF